MNLQEATDIIQKSGLSFLDVLQSETLLGQTWEEWLKKTPYVGTAMSWDMLCYQRAYVDETTTQVINLPLLLTHDHRPAGLWPISLNCVDGAWTLRSLEAPVREPIFLSSIGSKTQKAIVTQCILAAQNLCNSIGQARWHSIQSPRGSSLNEWHRKLMELGSTVQINHELYVDLSKSLEDIRANIRKSYRPLIAKASKLWSTRTYYRELPQSIFNEFRDLHRVVAGRSTRGLETWEIQRDSVIKGNAFFIELRDPSRNAPHPMIGGGFFNLTRDEAVYSVGAYDRSLFDMPLGHLVQDRALEFLKTNSSAQVYFLGERPYPYTHLNKNLPRADQDKEESIGRFKEGFATTLFMRLHMSTPTETAD